MYLYHWVPEGMTGNILYPLNTLKSKYPDLYAKHATKYAGRENLMDITIPVLNCKWNDVLHLTAVHPEKVAQALREAGHTNTKFVSYQINTEQLDPKNLIIYLYTDNLLQVHEKDFIPFTGHNLKTYCEELSEETKQYYRDAVLAGNPVFPYHLCPHVFYKGEIDISDCSIIIED